MSTVIDCSSDPSKTISTIAFELARNRYVSLEIYDSAGRLVETRLDAELQSGKHSYETDVSRLQDGVYFYTLKFDDSFVISRQLVVGK